MACGEVGKDTRAARRLQPARLEPARATANLRFMRPDGHRLARGVAAVAASVVALACVPGAVRWDGDAAPGSPVPADGGRLSLAVDGPPAVGAEWRPPTLPAAPLMCPGSLVSARARGDTAFAAWWQARPDGSSLLVVARSDDGGAVWAAAVTADSTDRARSGCRRPPPFLGADLHNGYVHVTYFLVGAEGPGLFFTHSMERGTMFHAPVAITYGERPSATALASSGDTVAVAYLDPNSAVPQVWLALSRSTGHIFESRTAVSSANVAASRPLVAISGNRIAVAWTETGGGGAREATLMRVGRMQ